MLLSTEPGLDAAGPRKFLDAFVIPAGVGGTTKTRRAKDNDERARRTTRSKQKKAPKTRTRTGVKAGGPFLQHGTRVRVRVRTNVKASGPVLQHGVRVRQAS